MTDDPWQDPGWLEYAQHARDELVPKMKGSAITMAFVPDGEPDVKFAVELGFMILLDKPIIAVVMPGVKVPDKLVRVADEIVEYGTPDDPVFQKRMMEAIARVQALVDG